PSVSRGVAARWTKADELLGAVRRRKEIEDLCVLYVALTRARRRLDLLVTRGGGRGACFAKILRSALGAPPPKKPRKRKGEAAESAAEAPTSSEPVLLHDDPDPGASAPLLSAEISPRPLPAPAAPVKPEDGRPAPAPAARPRPAWLEGSA